MFFVVRSNDSFNFPLGLIKCIVIVVIVIYIYITRTTTRTDGGSSRFQEAKHTKPNDI